MTFPERHRGTVIHRIETNYRSTPDWAAAIRKQLGERAIANVIDTVGVAQYDDNVGLLGEGVASSTAFDAQAKGLGEYLLSRVWRG